MTCPAKSHEKGWARLWRSSPASSWVWLLYLDVFLPGLLFFLAWLPWPFRTALARLFHLYALYILKPIPSWSSGTGLPGLALHIFWLVRALVRKNWLDALLCLLLTLAAGAFFWLEIDGVPLNYAVIRPLDFGLSVSP